jgi:hypothetical protein
MFPPPISQMDKALDSTEKLITRIEDVAPSSSFFSTLTPQQAMLKDECDGVLGHMLMFKGIMEGIKGNFMKAAMTLRYVASVF